MGACQDSVFKFWPSLLHVKMVLSTKFVLVFSLKAERQDAMEERSPLWDYLGDLRLWSNREDFNERMVWLECVGIPLTCWNRENITSIVEVWRVWRVFMRGEYNYDVLSHEDNALC